MPNSNKFMPTIYCWLSMTAALGLGTLSLTALADSDNAFLVTHQIQIELDPSAGTLSATDRIRLPSDHQDRWRSESLLLQLHQGLEPQVARGDARLEPVARRGHLAQYRLLIADENEVELHYEGRIQHDFAAVRESMGRERQQSTGTISSNGVFLSGYSGWYPRVLGSLENASLEVTLPKGWLAVAQGEGPSVTDDGQQVRIGWHETAPQDELYLIAAPFELYRRPTEKAEAQAFLRRTDDDLAERYLEATELYLERYSDLIGDYPYAKFALVENFWETGYGMPSFTLLGPRVMRLPFILHSSYPHEILHNWWGNGVYVDYAQGNWSEGLTAYLSDHLNQEIAGKGSDYRRDQLKAFADYVRDNEDSPLIAFQGRHGAASQAIGYGKTLMLFHMLRTQLGDSVFVQGLRRFYRDNRFAEAGWKQIETAFEAESGQDLSHFFDAWTSRPGAPSLGLESVVVEPLEDRRWRLSARLVQTQSAVPFPMHVPIALLDETGNAKEVQILMQERSADFSIVLDARPAHLAVDPRFDTFRRLADGESTATLSTLFGAQRGLILVPSEASAELRTAYRQLSEDWQRGHPGWSVALDSDVEKLPTDRAVWLLGWRNRWLGALAAVGEERGQFALDPSQHAASLLGTDYSGRSLVITANHGEHALGLVAASNSTAISGLSRKLPHYGKYGYLAFEGSAPTNIAKGQWPAGESSLTRWLGQARPAIHYPPRPALVDEPADDSAYGSAVDHQHRTIAADSSG